MKYLFAAGSRSGSEFSIRLITALTGKLPEPFGRVHSARESQGDLSPKYSFFKRQGEVYQFVNVHKLEALKLEDPGVDDDAYILFDHFPKSIVIATYRPLFKIINSHGNIKPWGMKPETVFRNFLQNLDFYEYAKERNRLILIDLEDRDHFDAEASADLLQRPVSRDWDKFFGNWPVVNDLRAQKAISNDTSECSFHISREDTLKTFPNVTEIERRYKALF